MPSQFWRRVSALAVSLVAALAVTITPAVAASTSIWSSAATPQGVDNDASAVELGLRFQSDTSGYITGVRFYKFASNTGTHVGNLWTSAGQLLASATFAAETASGWQEVSFTTPVQIAPNTTYVVSYHTNVGHYAATSGYFASGFDSGTLHALADGVAGGNGVYRYGAASAFPNASWQATNYWVDVVFTTTLGAGADTTPPTVNSVTPSAGATGVNVNSVITATFTEMMSPAAMNTATFQLRDSAGNLVPASVWAGGETPTATLSPTLPLAMGTSYTATAKGGPNGVKDLAGNPMAADFSWSFTTSGPSPAPATCPCSLWNASTPVGGMDGDTSAVELGVRFRSDTSGFITGLRFYKWSANVGTHIGNVWSNTGTRLATATFTGETATGWQQVMFATPVAIAANTTYVASYHTDSGHYAASGDYFVSPFDSAPLHALRDGVDGPSGVYRYGATGFPTDSYRSANYWVDVVFATSVATTPLTVTSVSPAAGATSVSTTSIVTASIVGFLSYASVNTTTFELRDSAGNLVPASVGGGGETQTFTLAPSSPLAFNTRYTATVKGGATGIKDVSGNPMASDYTWSFTTGAAPPPPPVTCPCTIWNAASTTAAGPEADASPVELGVRFRSDTDGYITGVRFYKFASNTGAHTGALWTNTGTRLAAAAFRSESTSGWQQVMFDTPVAITANTTYVASYHTDAGHYAANGNYFVAGFDSPPLHALRDGVDGPDGVYRYSATAYTFPDQTYFAANYWVDVVFVTALPPDVTAPKVVSTFPSAGAAGVGTNVTITATFSESMDPATIDGNSVELRDASGALVPASVAYSVPNGTAILRPTSAMAIGTTYTVTVKGGTVDPRAKDLAGNALAADYSWTFTTVGPPPPAPTGCPCSIWSASTTPAVIDNDSSAVEVGVRFQSEATGYISGIRFYKGTANTGVHVGSLWTNTGTLLARATFTNETASGWQEVKFTSPVAIEANTTYVASYHTDVGHYAATGGYFANASVDNPPLHAPRDGVAGANGVYVYGTSSAFPFFAYDSANYWVDVVYNPTQTDTLPPAASVTTPATGATGVDVTSWLWSQVMLPTSILTATHTLTSIGLNGNAVAFSKETIKGIEYAIFTVAAGSYRAT